MKVKNKDTWEFIILALILGGLFLSNIRNVPFVGDESLWINRSYYLELYFSGQFRAIIHDPSPSISMSMPTIPEYLIGLSRWIGGYGPGDLNQMYGYGDSFERNKAQGRVPSDGLLWWSRFLPSLLGAISILLVFYLIKSARKSLAGYIWLLFALINTFLVSSLQVAMSESPLVFCVVLAAFAAYKSMQGLNGESSLNPKSLIWISLFGVFTGLAGQSKNNGLAIFPAGIFILILLTVRIKHDFFTRIRFFGVGLVGMALAIFLFFVGPNPLLWKHPIKSSLDLIPYRIGLMQRQAERYPQTAINGWHEWLRIVPKEIFDDLTPVHFFASSYAKFVLACLGLCVLAAKAWKSWRDRQLAAGAIALLTIGITASLLPLFTPLNWDRYFLIPVFFVTIFMAIGADFVLESLWRLKKLQNKNEIDQNVEIDSMSLGTIADSNRTP